MTNSDYSHSIKTDKYFTFVQTEVCKMIVEIYSNVLLEPRTEKGISQERLAEYCDLDRTYISLLERGQWQPTITTVFKIAQALEIKASVLISILEKELPVQDYSPNPKY